MAVNLDANPYVSLFKAAGAKYGIDYRVLEAVAKQESGFNPKARSSAGAMGMMQFMPGTAQSYGIDPWDPAQAIDGAARYLTNSLRALNGNLEFALASYNAGLGAVQKAHGIPHITQTQNYVKSIMAMLGGTSSGGGGGGGQPPSFDLAGAIAGAQLNGLMPGGPVASPTSAPFQVPKGGVLLTVNGIFQQVVYPAVWDLANGGKNNTWIVYRMNPNAQYDLSGLQRVDISSAQWDAQYKDHTVLAGDASELDSVAKTYGDFATFWKWIVDTHLGANEAAKQDSGVLKVMAQLAARPDMSDAEIQNLLQTTDYWKTKTQSQLDWNDLSPAEQQKRTDDASAQLQDQFFQLVGRKINMTDGAIHLTAPDINNLQWWAQQVASGAKGMNDAVTTWIKAEATLEPESPWSRTLRNEKENQLQRGNDVENQTAKVQDMANQWGVQMSAQTMGQWGQDIISKKSSDADLLAYLKQQSSILYPWKAQIAPDMTTKDAAQPWLQTWERVMETPGDILNPKVQDALSKGTPVWQFEQDLKKNPAWTQTKNAQQTMETMLGEVGRKFGFA